MSDAADFMFGNKDTPGVLGTGQFRPDTYNINGDAANAPHNAENRSRVLREANEARLREAPTMQAAQLGSASQANAAQIGANERVGNQQIGNIERAQAANTGQAGQMDFAAINRQDAEGRGYQSALQSQLYDQTQGKGPSLAGMQLQDAQERNAKMAMSLAASGKGSNPALGQRLAMQNVAAGNQQAARDAAQTRIQEQMNAQGQLANVSSAQRQQDIGVNTSQAQMQQDAAGRNLDARNQFALQNAGYQQQANLANAQAYNQRQSEQAQLNQNAALFNAGQTNQTNLNQAQFQQQANLANQAANNQFALTQGQFQQQAAMSNLDAYLKNQAMNDQYRQFANSAVIGMSQADRNAAMQMEQMRAQQNMGYNQLQAQAYESAAGRNSGAFGSAVGAVAGLAMLSDEKKKTDVKDAKESDMDKFMKMFKSGSAMGGAAGGGNSFASGFASGMGLMSGFKPEAKKPAPKDDPSGTMGGVPVMNNPNMAIAIPGAATSINNDPNAAIAIPAVPAVPGVPAVASSDENLKTAFSQPSLGELTSFLQGGKGVGGGIDMGGKGSISGSDIKAASTGTANTSGMIRGMVGGGGITGGNMGNFRMPMGGGMSMSDENQKQQVAVDADAPQDFLDKIKAHKYRYKNPDMPGAGHGEFVSPMAQELEKSKLGKSMVLDTPNGKMVDYGKGFGTILAAMATMNDRLNKLDKKKGK